MATKSRVNSPLLLSTASGASAGAGEEAAGGGAEVEAEEGAASGAASGAAEDDGEGAGAGTAFPSSRAADWSERVVETPGQPLPGPFKFWSAIMEAVMRSFWS